MALWNPRQLLDVYPQLPGFTCVGSTKEGRRCRQSFLKNIHRAEADRVLDALPPPGHFALNSSQLYPTLRHLAWLTLCPRWHQNGPRCQADAVASKWLRTIVDSIPNTATTYAGYQARALLPLSPPLSPVPNVRAIGRVPSSLHAQNTGAAVLPPSPPLSPTQHSSASTVGHTNRASTTINNPPQVSSSIGTTARDGSIRIDLNVTIVLEQSGQANATRRSSNNFAATSSESNGTPRSSASSNRGRGDQASSRSGSSSSSASNRAITYHDVQTILARLESLERQAEQVINNGRSAISRSATSRSATSRSVTSRSSRASSRTSNRTITDPRSPAASTISDLYLPPPIRRPEFFFSPPRSPPPIPHAGSLSISTDSEPTSPTIAFNTPSSSGSSTPSLAPQLSRLGNPALGAPGPSSVPTRVQRRAITSDTECGICLEPIYSAGDSVWCRGTCGQNVHTECFDEWLSYRNGNMILCTYCRQPWVF